MLRARPEVVDHLSGFLPDLDLGGLRTSRAEPGRNACIQGGEQEMDGAGMIRGAFAQQGGEPGSVLDHVGALGPQNVFEHGCEIWVRIDRHVNCIRLTRDDLGTGSRRRAIVRLARHSGLGTT